MVTSNRTLQGAVFVLGMHRSGTSALTRGLEVLGIDLGKNLKEPVAGDNEKGFFEDWALSLINDELLEAAGDRWDSLSTDVARDLTTPHVRELKLKAIAAIDREFGSSRYFAFKDPRTCRVLPFWKDVLQRQELKPHYVIAFRNPLSVARSLAKRDGFSHARAYYLWLVHVLNAVRHTEGASRLFVDYDALLADPNATLSRIADHIGDPHIAVSQRELDIYTRDFIDRQLRHDRSLPSHLDLDPACSPLVKEVYALLRQEAEGSGAEPNAAWAPKIEAFALLAPHLELLETIDRDLRHTRIEVAQREQGLAELHANVAALQDALKGLDETRRSQVASLQNEAQAAHAAHAQEVAELGAAAQASGKYIASLTEQFAADIETERQQSAARLEAIERQHEILLQDTIAAERNAAANGVAAAELQFKQILADMIDAERTDAERKLDSVRREASMALDAMRAQAEATRRHGEQAIDAARRHANAAIEQEREQAARNAAAQADSAAAQVDAARRQGEAAQRQVQHSLDAQTAALDHVRREYDALAQRLRETYGSSSWRLTAPLRALRSALGGGALDEAVPPFSRPDAAPILPRIDAAQAPVVGQKRRVHFTICAKNYLPIARVCLESSKRFHPEADHYLVLCDVIEQGYDPSREQFGVIPVSDIAVPSFADMALRYDVMELNTAVKPFCFTHFFAQGADEVVYLDPDLYFLKSMSAIRDAFDGGADAVVTPHINQPIEDDKSPGDRDMLRAGVYNLGFLALRRTPHAEAFARWWGDRLRMGAVSDIARGLFTDQKWCDLLPSFVPNTTVLHRPGYNLAYWNLMHRPVRREGETWLAAGEPICFVHFSGASFTDPNVFSKHQNRYDANSIGQMRELYDLYRGEVRARGFGAGPAYRYAYDFDAQGRRIPPILRHIYRDELAPDRPAEAPDLARLVAYAREPAPNVRRFDGVLITRLTHRIWRTRPDLQAAFDINSETGQRGFVEWASAAMPREYGIEEGGLPAAAQSETPASRIPTQPPTQASPLSDLSRTVLAHSASLRPIYRHLPTRWRERARVALTRSAYAPPRAEEPVGGHRPGAALIGYARGELGMGEHVRMTAAALEHEGVPMGIVNISENLLARQEDRRFDHLHTDADFRVNIFHVNADQLPTVTAGLGDQFLAGKRNIAYPFWELGDFPEDWMPQLNAMDELWAPSKFIRDALGRATRPVVHMPVAVELAPGYEKWRREHFNLPSEAFCFLFYFDLASFSSRKNPIGVLDAFKRAVEAVRGRSPRPVCLVVKVISADRFPKEYRALQEMTYATPGVVLMPEVFSADKIHGLVNCTDAFVSLHRSEGFGRGPAEAMRLGKVAIATGYSGNMDYMNEENSFPVPYELRAVGADEYPYGAGQYWADPDVGAAAQIMTKLIMEPALQREMGARAKSYMAKHHAQDAIGRRYAERLKAIGALN